MTHGSLFSGIGGFDLAAEWMGWTNIFHCEIEEFPRTILNHYWPNAISYEDITKTDFTIHRGQIDILTGGFPCQPYSQAGKRLGKEDERHLWPEMLRAITEIAPRWVVGENVYGLVNWNGGVVFEEVQADLENEGYKVQPYILPAAGVGAPHQRYRVWFVAHSEGGNDRGAERKVHKENGRQVGELLSASGGAGERLRDQRVASNARHESRRRQDRCEDKRGRELLRKEQQRSEVRSESSGCGSQRTTANTSSAGRKEQHAPEEPERERYGSGARIEKPDAWNDFPTESPVCGRNDGLPAELDGITFPKWRNESIKAYGNAIVPQVALQIFKAIQSCTNQN